MNHSAAHNPVWPPPKHPRTLRILCAEDDESLARMLVIALGRAGHVVDRVADGHHALERIAGNAACCDLLVTDHRMPRLSGLELITQVRRSTFAGKIIVHSSYLREDEEAAYRALAVDHIFTKPVKLTELLAVVGRLAT